MRTDNSWLGSAEGPSGSYVVGSYGTFNIVYTVGKYGIDDGGSIRVARRGGMKPQTVDPKSPGYTTVTATRDVRLVSGSLPITQTLSKDIELFGSKRSALRASHIRPFWSAFQVDVKDGSLYEGDQLVFTFGDTSQGSPGYQLKTSREAEYLFKVFVDPFGTGLYKPVPGSPRITITGETSEEIQVVVPSQAVKGEPFDVTVRALDLHGNRSDSYRGKVKLKTGDSELPKPYSFKGNDAGAHRFTEVVLNKAGIHRISVEDDQGNEGTSNPVMVMEKEPELKLYWGGRRPRPDKGDRRDGLCPGVPFIRQGRGCTGLHGLAGERFPDHHPPVGARKEAHQRVPRPRQVHHFPRLRVVRPNPRWRRPQHILLRRRRGDLQERPLAHRGQVR
jgi:hypothetical protein